jgi:hypothetical protein
MISSSTSTHPYADAAREKFDALTKRYSTNDTGEKVSFWKLGNSFDTMIDFLDTIDASRADDVAQMAVKQLEASLKNIEGGYDGAWFDDFGWWSVATQRALKKPFFRKNAKALQDILDACWPRFTSNAPFVWERRKPGTFDKFGPAVDGGVWNAYWTCTSDEYPGPKNGDPSDGHLVGIQNTVTNALYLMAAHRIGHSNPDAERAAQQELKFLLAWFDQTEDSLWWQIDPNTALVRERVGHFANGVHAPHSDNGISCTGFQGKWAWTGDQGLILGALSDATLHLEPGFRAPLLNRTKQLLSGVRNHLAGGSAVVVNYTTTGCVPDFDESDYQVGSGVFWRNALYVWKTNPDLRTFLEGEDYKAMVRASAAAVATLPTAKETIETLTNQTAVLVAANAMLESATA